MQTVAEMRRQNLLKIKQERAENSWAALNQLLGRPARDATLSQIGHGHLNSGNGKPRTMGDAVARAMEHQLGYPVGWMDHDHGPIAAEPVAAYQVHNEPHAKLLDVLHRLTQSQLRELLQQGQKMAAENEAILAELQKKPDRTP